MRHCVVGSGPCGALAALILLKSGISVDMIEFDNHEESKIEGLKGRLKLIEGKSSPYDVNQFLEIQLNGELATFYRSKEMAGFSKVWGATWDSPLVSDDPSWIKHYEEVTEIVFSSLKDVRGEKELEPIVGVNCDCLDFISHSEIFKVGDVSKSNLAISADGCGCVLLGKGVCPHGSIWNSLSLIDACQSFKNFRLITGVDVQIIVPDSDCLQVKSETHCFFYDSVTLATGPLGTSEILLNSYKEIQAIRLAETRMGYMPFLKFRLNTGHTGSFAFSKFRLDIEDSNNFRESHVQVYAHSELYVERILEKVPKPFKFFAKLIMKFLASHLGIVLFYLNSSLSESLELKAEKDFRRLIVTEKAAVRNSVDYKRGIKLSVRRMGLFPLAFALRMARVGESYHLGAAPDVLDEFGFITSDKRISVAGSFALPEIVPGPITHAAMAQTSRLVERIVHQNLESI